MKILAVETATGWQSVALLDGTQVVARADEHAGGSHAKRLVPTIDRLFTSTGWSLQNVEGLVVSLGPGSFTGLRVGLATMLGFRSITGLPLVGVPTLEGMAWNVRQSDRMICPVLKSRIGEVYWAQYRWNGRGALESIGGEHVGSLEALAEAIQEEAWVFGEGWQANQDAIKSLLGSRTSFIHELPSGQSMASAVSVGLAGLELLGRGAAVDQKLAPRYVQRSEAEIMWDRRMAAAAEKS